MRFPPPLLGALGALLLATALLGSSPGSSGLTASARASGITSCGVSYVIHDYLRPLRRMLPVREVPSSEKLSFGPERMQLAPTDEGLQVGAGSVGFFLSDEAIGQRRHLNWVVETQLLKVDRRGRERSAPVVKIRKLGTVKGNEINAFSYPVSSTPAFYRVDIGFYTATGHRLLGRYSHYVRVVQARRSLAIEIETPTVSAGQFAKAKLMNLGTLPIYSAAYDFGFDVQALIGTRWVTLADNPRIGRVLKRMSILGPGRGLRDCLRYLVPASAPPGRYRFAAEGPAGDLSLAAEFEVQTQPAPPRYKPTPPRYVPAPATPRGKRARVR